MKQLKKSEKEKKKGPSKKKIIIAVLLLSFAFFGSFLIYFIMQIALNTQTPMVVVISGSMEPNIHKGDLLFLKGTDPEDIKDGSIKDKDGDVIVYDARGLWDGAPDEPIVHRVVDVWKNGSTWYFLTKGDANSKVDEEPVPDDRILGVVSGTIPYVGWVKIILTETNLLIPLIIILAVPLVLSIIWDIYKDEEKTEEKKGDVKKFKEEKPVLEIKKEEIHKKKLEKPIEDDFDF